MNFKKSLLGMVVALAAANVQAAGFQLHETSISGLGRSFAGEGVIADDASVLARNPAAMSLFDKASLSFGATYIDPGVDVKGTDAPDILGADFDMSRLHDDGVVPPAVVPFVYFINPVNDQFAYGLGLNVNYGLASEYDNDYAAGSIGGETDLFTLNFNASGSYRIDSNWTVGLGLNLVYADATLTRRAGAVLENGISLPIGPGGVSVPVQAPVPAETKIMDLEGDDIAWGWNTGVVYELNDNNRFSLTYRSEVEIDFDGDINEPSAIEGSGSLAIDLPAIAEFSAFHQLTNTWAVHYSVMHTDWDSFKKLEGVSEDHGVVFEKEENFESTLRLALGATYNYSNELTLRAGVAFDESAAQDDQRSISIPDSDRLWFSAGATYQLTQESSIDFGFSYIDGDEVDVVEQDAVLEGAEAALQEAGLPVDLGDKTWAFKSEGNAILVGLQYNRSF